MVGIRYPRHRPIRFMRLDGERALGNEFKEFAEEMGITVERSATDTPAQNRNAERVGGILTIVARAIRIHARLPANLWPEAYRTAGYLLNRIPVRQRQWQTPFQAVVGIKPHLAHLFLIGCKAYSLIHDIPRKQKLQPRASVRYLVRYDSTNIYRIWNPVKGQVFRTRDVTFDESSLYQPS